jgi:prepilin-type processing-associated H-X9-DG protein
MARPLRILSLVVVVVLATGLCLAVVSAISAARQSSECVNNLKQIALALNMYAQRGCFPLAAMPSEGLPPEKRLSWMAGLYADGFFAANVVLVLDESKPWDAEANLRPEVLVGRKGEGQSREEGRVFPTCVCPANPNRSVPAMPNLTSYVGISGLGQDAAGLPPGHPRAGIFGYERRICGQDIKDGASATMMVAETTLHNGPWTAGGLATVRGLDQHSQPYIGRGLQFGGMHRGGTNVAFADGSVRSLRETIDPKVFEALSTVAGGERLPTGWDQ